MEEVFDTLVRTKKLLVILVAVLLFSFHFYFTYFINSTYLVGYVGERAVAFVYAAAAILNVAAFAFTPRLLRRYGNLKLTLAVSVVCALSLCVLAVASSLSTILITFVVYQAVAPVLIYSIDIFLEKFSSINDQGSVRGMYLTMMNIPPLITPFVVGLILTKPEFWKIYLTAAVFLIPFFVIIFSYFKDFKDSPYPEINVRVALTQFYRDKNVFDVFLDNFLLHFFYGWMAIYMPIYLHNYIGFQWSEIGVMFSIMILPFILFQIPVGRMEDERHDEKFLLILGFTIIACSTLLIPFMTEPNFVIWTALLFLTRIGACIVEVSSESYFFKHIQPDNAGFMSFFRVTRSLPYVFIPIVGVLLAFIEFKYTFLILGLIMLLGIRYAFKLDKKTTLLQ